MEILWRSTIFNAAILAALLTLSHGIMKWVAIRAKGNFLDLLQAYWLPLGFAIGIYVFLFLYYTQVLRSTQLNLLYPLYGGLSILLVFIMGTWLFGESVTTLKIIGCLFIVAGVIMVTK